MLLRPRKPVLLLVCLCVLLGRADDTSAAPFPTPRSIPPRVAARPLPVRHPLTTAERRYLIAMRRNSARLRLDMADFARMTARPRMKDERWVRGMALVLSALHVYVQQGQALAAPPRYQAAQAIYLRSLAQYERVYRVLPVAIGRRDRAGVIQSRGYLSAAGRYDRLAAQEIVAASLR